MSDDLIKEGNLETPRHKRIMPCEDRGGDWDDSSISQGTLRAAGTAEARGEKHGADSHSESAGRGLL